MSDVGGKRALHITTTPSNTASDSTCTVRVVNGEVCQLDVNAEAEGMFEALLRIMASEVAFEVHRALHTGEMSLEDLYAEKRSGDALGLGLGEQRAGLDVFGRAPPREPSGGVTCPTCGRQVGVLRFAPHLDKCMKGSVRTTSRPTGGGDT